MADKHDETARELLAVLEWYAPRRRLQGIYDPKYSNDVRGVASALRKAEADGLRGAAAYVEQWATPATPHIVKTLRALAAKKETND